MLLHQEDLRTVLYCPKFYEFNGPKEESIHIKILNKLHSKITVLFLKNQSISVSEIYTSLLSILSREDTSDMLPSDRTNLLNKINIDISDSLKKFCIDNYMPILGPITFNKSINGTTYSFQVNGIYKDLRNKTIHFAEFFDGNEHAALNDPALKIKLDTIKDIVPPHYTGRVRAYLHVFYYQNNEIQRLILSSEKNVVPDYSIVSTIINSKSYFPILPCHRKCAYKKQCN
tara:strand:- start:988 stop:1677 length:690 start_codon:yes stop_codon:yes gene_type:complete